MISKIGVTSGLIFFFANNGEARYVKNEKDCEVIF